jgi:hypothetical protein
VQAIRIPIENVLAAVKAYSDALAAGWPAPNKNLYTHSAMTIAGRTLQLRTISTAARKVRALLDTAVILGVPVPSWDLGDRWSQEDKRLLVLRYDTFCPGYRKVILDFFAGTPEFQKIADSTAMQSIVVPAMPESAMHNFKIDWDAFNRTSPSQPLVAIEDEVGAPAPPAPESRDVIEARRDKNMIAALKSQLKAAEQRVLVAEDRIADMDTLHRARVEPGVWLATPALKSALSLTPVLFTSDFQCGEVVRPDEIDGINEFNQDIFVERYQKMIDKTIALAGENTGATDFPGIVYLRGGDAISGEIHDELAETNDLSAVPAVRLVHQQEREGIKRLRDKFGKVRVISLPGNHGRTTFKPHAKGAVERNFETLLSWWLADSLAYDPNITFWTPHSVDALFEVEGWNGLLSHGDKMGSRGGQGFIGPAATIARGHQKLFQNWTATGKSVDFILTGHLHTSLKLERGFANGSLVGYGEYARDLRCLPDAAKQWLLFFHRETMVSHQFELQLSRKPRRIISDATL